MHRAHTWTSSEGALCRSRSNRWRPKDKGRAQSGRSEAASAAAVFTAIYATPTLLATLLLHQRQHRHPQLRRSPIGCVHSTTRPGWRLASETSPAGSGGSSQAIRDGWKHQTAVEAAKAAADASVGTSEVVSSDGGGGSGNSTGGDDSTVFAGCVFAEQ